MPLEAGALLLDSVGLGQPLWALTGSAIDGLLRLAHRGRLRAGRGGDDAVDAALGIRR